MINYIIIYYVFTCQVYFKVGNYSLFPVQVKGVHTITHGPKTHVNKPVIITMVTIMRPSTCHEEDQYLILIRTILDTGSHRSDRTGTGTISLFAPPSLRFSLADATFPLLTTKRVFLRGIIEELLWFVKGATDGTLLSVKGIKIWDGNGSREFLDKRGLTQRRVGDLGPVYGFQWRHFGAKYQDCDTDYSGEGVDQLKEVIRKIREDPTDRRIIMSAWNPAGGFRLYLRLSPPLILCRHSPDGPAALPHVLPILRPPSTTLLPRLQAQTLMPHVPTLRRSWSRHPL